ncbi:peptidylprolyl isomerase [Albibacterium sp.]|uniref:peptidylprolyl isomerase n=1 Tax=Albibacterium sp. TaxID=2952885 RepID=UPI002B70FF6E|nr:SurA N-terminal domain-containing protein [Albibacterium sp.]HUH20143.1 SurA N-terminal domain-containing protein [Albibacterium sp.]
MGIMTFLRNRLGLLVVWTIGIALAAFLLGEIIPQLLGTMNANQNEVGVINGEKLDYATFNAEVEAGLNNMRQQMGGTLNDQMNAYVVENVWNQHLSQVILEEEIDRIGLSVGSSELNDMVSGQNPSPQIIQSFTNPQTGEFDRNQLSIFLTNIRNEPPSSIQKQQWEGFLRNIRQERLQQKYNQLIQNSVYVTSLEANEDFIQRNKIANFSYVLLDYSSINNTDIKLTEEDYKAYYDDHKAAFFNPVETRSIEYVVFDAEPSASDTLAVHNKAIELAQQLATAENDSLFASINSDTKYPIAYYKKGDLSPNLDSALFNGSTGSVVGPFFSNGTYELAKILDSRMSPDSVTASHILLNPAAEGGNEQANAKADSIKTLIQKGANFATLAAEFSTDGSRNDGGKLGTFPRGAMIPAFENAVFNGKPGDLIVLTTQFGVHIIKIDDQIGSSRVVKAAIIDKSIQSSKETLNAAYNKASSFFGKVTKDNFKELAQTEGYETQVGAQIAPMQSSIQNLMNPRELIRWIYQAKVGDVTDKVYELENKYVVARLTQIREKGILPFETVKQDIEPAVINQVKANQLMKKADEALNESSTIEQVAQKLARTPVEVQNTVFANPILAGIGQENRVVGTVFGLQPSTISKSIEGKQGVYIVSVRDFVNPNQPLNLISIKQQNLNSIKQRVPGAVLQVLHDRAEITDNRVRFY